MPITEQLMHATVRLEAKNAAGQVVSTGTGFFFRLFETPNTRADVVVTNKHVVAGAASMILYLTMAGSDGRPNFDKIRMELHDFASRWNGHPDPETDLAVFSCNAFAGTLQAAGKTPFYVTLNAGVVPTDTQLAELVPVEDVLVVGYPNGLWDATHTAPIFRRGITATAPFLDFNGERKFLIDSAIFPGSSGSPVLLYNAGGWATRAGDTALGSRLWLLGVVSQVYNHLAPGEITVQPAPMELRPVASTLVPNNLGVCIKASRILEFEPFLVEAGLVQKPEGFEFRNKLPAR